MISQRLNVLRPEYNVDRVNQELDHVHKQINERNSPFTRLVRSNTVINFGDRRVGIAEKGLTLTLPVLRVADQGLRFYFKDRTGDATANPHTILPSTGKTIDGASSDTIGTDYASQEYEWSGTEWFKV